MPTPCRRIPTVYPRATALRAAAQGSNSLKSGPRYRGPLLLCFHVVGSQRRGDEPLGWRAVEASMKFALIALPVSALLALSTSPTSAESLSCTTVNGERHCAHGSSSTSCKTVDGHTEC